MTWMDCVGCGSASVTERREVAAQCYRGFDAGTAAGSSASAAAACRTGPACRATSSGSVANFLDGNADPWTMAEVYPASE
jgi:hypothetical protein